MPSSILQHGETQCTVCAERSRWRAAGAISSRISRQRPTLATAPARHTLLLPSRQRPLESRVRSVVLLRRYDRMFWRDRDTTDHHERPRDLNRLRSAGGGPHQHHRGGDGLIVGGEDDGNTDSTDGCTDRGWRSAETARCEPTSRTGRSSEADDGNTEDDDACLNTCQVARGDGIVRADSKTMT